jgi:predicted DsbA family dithiol-disulfide isomerase
MVEYVDGTVEDVVAVEKPRERIAMVWAMVEVQADEQGQRARFPVRRVFSLSKAKEIVAQFRAVGMRCGYDYDFEGVKMSTPKQAKLMFAYAREQGWNGS